MFTPEFIIDDSGEFILVANHSLESVEALQASIKYNIARIAYGKAHLPTKLQNCRLIYDIRGQIVTNADIDEVKQAFEGSCILEFKK